MPSRFAVILEGWNSAGEPTGGTVVDSRNADAPHRARCPHCGKPVKLYTYPDAPSIYVHADAEEDEADGFCPLDARCRDQEK